MSFLLSEPTAVLVVGDGDPERIEAAITADESTDIERVADCRAAQATLSARDDVGCVVVTEGAIAVDCVRTLRARAPAWDDHLPIVVVGALSASDRATITSDPGCAVVSSSADAATLRETVDAALAEFDRKRRERAAASLMTALLERSNQELFVKDKAGQHLYVSDTDQDHLDESRMRGKTDREIYDTDPRREELARADFEDDMHVVKTGEPIYGRVRKYYSGMEHWFSTTKVPWENEAGERQGLVGISREITDRRLAERQMRLQANRIDQFTRYLTENLQSPIDGVLASLGRAAAGDLDAIDDAEAQITQIEHLIDDLHRLSSDTAGQTPGSQPPKLTGQPSLTTDLVALTESVWSVLEDGDADLVVELPEETTLGVETETIRPFVSHLLENAIEHAGPDVTVWVGAAGLNSFYVADDGPGLPEDERAAFDGNTPTSSEEAWNGLDVVIATANQQGWDLSVEASRAGGTRFVVANVPMTTQPVPDLGPASRVDLTERADVGDVALPGNAEYDAETDRWLVSANGENVWRHTNEFYFVYGTATPPVRIEGHVETLDSVNEWTKGGFAIRAGTDERDPFGYVGVTGDHGPEVTWRSGTDRPTSSFQFEELAGRFEWYRVEYVDDIVVCFLSPDGEEWVPVDQRALDLGERVAVGILLCSHSTKTTCEATFTDVCAWELDAVDESDGGDS